MAEGYLFPYLIDSPLDDVVDEHGWLPLAAAATPEEAAAEFARIYEDSEPPIFTCSGVREWLIAELDDTGESPGRMLRGAEAEQFVKDNHYYDEELRYRTAEPGESGAQEWWRVEAIPRCGAYDEEDDFYCGLADGHEGKHRDDFVRTVAA